MRRKRDGMGDIYNETVQTVEVVSGTTTCERNENVSRGEKRM